MSVALSSLSDVLALRADGVFSADSTAIARIYAFADSDDFSVADRAAALRFLCSEFFGFDGIDAGDGVPDADYLSAYLAAR